MNMTFEQRQAAAKISDEIRRAIEFPEFPDIAREAFTAYRLQQKGIAFDGSPIPSWEEVPERIRVAWVAAVIGACHAFVTGVTGDLGCFLRAHMRGEPTFTLIGRDPTSFATILFWILQNPTAPASKLREAFTKADLCRAWPQKKAAD